MPIPYYLDEGENMQPDDLLEIISDKTTGIDVGSLDQDQNLDDQGLDSLDIISTLFAVEEKYNIKISEDDIAQGKLTSINAIVEFVNSLTQ
jgi:acyl carrier protein